jgi:hypothetical protein
VNTTVAGILEMKLLALSIIFLHLQNQHELNSEHFRKESLLYEMHSSTFELNGFQIFLAVQVFTSLCFILDSYFLMMNRFVDL